jgi:hypothetical protein
VTDRFCRVARVLRASWLLAAPISACVSSEEVDLGRNVGGDAAPGIAGGSDAALGDDRAAPLFSVAISAAEGTLCQGACVELVASASGAPGPYAYVWGQGLGQGAGPKPVCPLATTTYSVTVSSDSSALVATSSATVVVVPCDAGAGSSPRVDAAAPLSSRDSGSNARAGTLCVPDPSFEGTPMVGTSGPPGISPTAAPPGWQVCQGDPDIDPSVSLLPAADGTTYVGLAVGSGAFSSMAESVGTTLCSPLQAGTSYSFCLDLAIGVQGVMSPLNPSGGPVPVLEIWGGRSPCGQDQLLWTSPSIVNKDSWTKVCGTLLPSQNLADLSLIPVEASGPGPGAWSYVIVDNITAGP